MVARVPDRARRDGVALALAAALLGAVSPAWGDAPIGHLTPDQAELLSYLSEQWVLIETPHVRLFAATPERVHRVALAHVESFVETTLDALQASPQVRADLQRDPIRYYLCAYPQEVQLLGGARSEGVSLLERRAIVSRWLPHDHEIVHLLAHETVAPGPALVPPLLQEGLASAWGGQRGLAPEVVLHHGEQLLREGRIDLTRLWEYDEFHGVARDLSIPYAVSARFVQYLLDAYGIDPFLRLYRMLAGDVAEVRRRPAQVDILQVEQVYDTTWPAMLEAFRQWRVNHPTGFAEPATAPSRRADLQAADDGRFLSVWNEADGSMVVGLQGMTGAPEGLVTWGPPLPATYHTRLYKGRLRGPLPRFGLRITSDGLELYDYGLDEIVAELRRPQAMGALEDDDSRRVVVRLLPRALVHVERPYEVSLLASPRLEY